MSWAIDHSWWNLRTVVDAVVRALASHQCGLGSILVVDEIFDGSRPCSEGFSPSTPVFLPPQKPTFPNSSSTWKHCMKEPTCVSHGNSHLFYLFYRICSKLGSVHSSKPKHFRLFNMRFKFGENHLFLEERTILQTPVPLQAHKDLIRIYKKNLQKIKCVLYLTRRYYSTSFQEY